MKNKNALLIFVFALLLYGLFSDIIPLVDPDEPVYGETAKVETPKTEKETASSQ